MNLLVFGNFWKIGLDLVGFNCGNWRFLVVYLIGCVNVGNCWCLLPTISYVIIEIILCMERVEKQKKLANSIWLICISGECFITLALVPIFS